MQRYILPFSLGGLLHCANLPTTLTLPDSTEPYAATILHQNGGSSFVSVAFRAVSGEIVRSAEVPMAERRTVCSAPDPLAALAEHPDADNVNTTPHTEGLLDLRSDPLLIAAMARFCGGLE